MINKVLSEIANFEIIPSENINDYLFYLPEADAFNLNFEECGIESRFFLLTMGLPLYIMLVHFALLVIYILLTLCNCILKSPCLSKIINHLRRYLFWNGFLRLYMELYSGLALSAVLNMHTNMDDKNSPFRWAEISIWASIVSIYFLALLPIIFVLFYCFKSNQWSDIAFTNTYGSLLEGTRVDKRSSLVMPTVFVYRRLIFITSIILLGDNIFFLTLIQISMVLFQLFALHSLRVFESKADLWKQTQDECTYLLLLYVFMCFNDFVPDPEMRSELGIVYISIMFSNIGVHFINLIRSTLSSLILSVKRNWKRRHLYICMCCFKCCRKKIRSYTYAISEPE